MAGYGSQLQVRLLIELNDQKPVLLVFAVAAKVITWASEGLPPDGSVNDVPG